MKQILITFALVLTGLALFGQSPRIRLNQITKDSITGSVVLSGSDSNMVYSRDFFINFQDSVLLLFGDTLSTTATAFTGVTTDLTLTGNGTSGSELKVDTAVIATVSALADSLAGIISSVTTDLTLTGDGSVATPLKVDTTVIATIKAISDSIGILSFATNQDISDSLATLSFATNQDISDSLQGFATLQDITDTLDLNTRGYLTAEVDGSVSNEGSLTVGAGTGSTSIISSNTSGSTDVTLQAGSHITLTESGNTITIASSGGGGGSVDTDLTLTGDGSGGDPLKVDTTIISTIAGLNDSLATKGTVNSITAGTFLSGGTITSSGTIALDTASAGLKTYISDNSSGGSSFNNISETADTVFVSKFLNVDTSTLYVDAVNNRVGIGMSSPTSTLEVNGNSCFGDECDTGQANRALNLIASNSVMKIFRKIPSFSLIESPSLEFLLGQDSLFSGKSNIYWDVFTNYNIIGSDTSSAMFFRARKDYGTTSFSNQKNVLSMLFSGEVGIGTDSPAYTLDVVGDINASGEVRNSGVILTSDARYKKNITPINNAKEQIMLFNPVSYYWNDLMLQKIEESKSKTKTSIKYGLVAQEVEAIMPEFVSEGEDGYKAIDYQAIITLLIKFNQTQQTEIDTLKTQIQNILTEINNLKNN